MSRLFLLSQGSSYELKAEYDPDTLTLLNSDATGDFVANDIGCMAETIYFTNGSQGYTMDPDTFTLSYIANWGGGSRPGCGGTLTELWGSNGASIKRFDPDTLALLEGPYTVSPFNSPLGSSIGGTTDERLFITNDSGSGIYRETMDLVPSPEPTLNRGALSSVSNPASPMSVDGMNNRLYRILTGNLLQELSPDDLTILNSRDFSSDRPGGAPGQYGIAGFKIASGGRDGILEEINDFVIDEVLDGI